MSLETEFHTELEVRVTEFLTKYYSFPTVNFRLPTGRIADLILITPAREVWIIEVKTVLKHSLIIEAAEKYYRYCNRLFVAAPESEIFALPRPSPSPHFRDPAEDVGLMSVTPRAVQIFREARQKQISGDTFDYLRVKLRERITHTVVELGRNGE